MSPRKKDLNQKIAVFGPSGSGKTVLISSFYGSMLEPDFLDESIFEVRADDPESGLILHQNYLQMRDANAAPVQNRFADRKTLFRVLPRDLRQNEQLQLEWHDYPGEWFETKPSGAEEEAERIEAFKSLITSDIAIFLIDGAKLQANAGEEERYLKALFTSYRHTFESLRDGIVGDGPKLEQFPRIWMIGLSKADLLPHLDVYGLRDIVVGKAQGEINELSRTLKKFILMEDSFSLSEEFIILSSAEFEGSHIDVSRSTGIDLILPLAGVHPIEKFSQWKVARAVPPAIIEKLRAINAAPLLAAGLSVAASRLPGVKKASSALDLESMVVGLMGMAVTEIFKSRDDALKRNEFVKALIAEFSATLKKAESKRKLLRTRV